jgi:hypothetical protein
MGTKDERTRWQWQILLETILQEHPQALKPLANELGLTETSIRRWSQGKTEPRNSESALRRLVNSKHFPPTRKDAFIAAVQKSFPHFLESPDPLLDELPVKQIPPLFHIQVFRAYCFVEEQIAFRTVTNLVTQHLFSHLDADGSAQLAVQLLQCTPPSSEEYPVRSLYAPVFQIGVRPSPLAANWPIFFGMESPLVDLVTVLEGQQPYTFDRQAISEFPFPDTVRSLVLLPIQYRAKLAGCFLVTSSIPDYFNAERQKIVYELGITLALAFDQRDFYAIKRLAFANLPEFSSQVAREGLYPFRDRLRNLRNRLDEANQKQLERLAIQELEEDLISLQRKQRYERVPESAPPP